MTWTLYHYTPSAAAAGIFVGLFGLSTLYHFYQLIRTRTWFMIPLLIGGILETIGYVGRLLSALQAPNYTTGPYGIQSALTLIAPAFFAASIYMAFGRLIRMIHSEHNSIIRPRWLTKIFVTGDVVSFLMQASGAGLMIENSTNPSSGEHIIIGGLFVQIIFFGFFMITTITFQLRNSQCPSAESQELSCVWHRHLHVLCVTSILILIRSAIRVAEYIEGYDGYLMAHEVFIYVFDALLMFLVILILNFSHLSQINYYLGRGTKYFSGLFKVEHINNRISPLPASAYEMEKA